MIQILVIFSLFLSANEKSDKPKASKSAEKLTSHIILLPHDKSFRDAKIEIEQSSRSEEKNNSKNSNPSNDDSFKNKPLSLMDSTRSQISQLGEVFSYTDLDVRVPEDQELKRLRDFIIQKVEKNKNNSVVVTSPPGVGKSTMVENVLADLLSRGYMPVLTSASRLATGTSLRGQSEEKYHQMIELSKKNPNIVWVIDEIHSLKGAGTALGVGSDFFDHIKPALAKGIFKIIGMTTEQEYQKAFRTDPAIKRRFQVFKLQEPEGEVLEKRIRFWLNSVHGEEVSKKISPELLRESIVRSEYFSAEAAQPSKAITYVDALANRASELDRKANVADLLDVVKEINNLSEFFVNPEKMLEKLEGLREKLDERVIGQKEAKDRVVDATYLALSEMKDINSPKIKILLSGIKGQGKTFLPEVYAETMSLPIYRFNMASYSPMETEKLKYEIANEIQKNPFSVLVFDEIEKAPKVIQEALLDFLDRGRFNVSYTNRATNDTVSLSVDGRKSSVFLTANAGSEIIRQKNEARVGIGFTGEKENYEHLEKREGLHRELRAAGVEEFLLDRVEAVLVESLSKQEVIELALHKVENVLKFLKEVKDVSVKMTKKAKQNFIEHIVERNYSPTMSNRTIESAIESLLRVELAKNLIVKPEALEISFENEVLQINKIGKCQTLF